MVRMRSGYRCQTTMVGLAAAFLKVLVLEHQEERTPQLELLQKSSERTTDGGICSGIICDCRDEFRACLDKSERISPLNS